jgi:hypothetical protein
MELKKDLAYRFMIIKYALPDISINYDFTFFLLFLILITRYLRCQVFNSALGLFRELELWDEVVKCYQLMEKPHRAELVVRERIRLGETPYMLTALADLTEDLALYERAWELSNRRFARAKRTLGKIYYDRYKYFLIS